MSRPAESDLDTPAPAEKDVSDAVVSGVSNSSEMELGVVVQDWTEAEERRAKTKIDFILLPVLGLAFFALQMDRGNISSALTSTITKDLGITTNEINIGTQLLSAGIVLLELPSNIALQKIGPQIWLSGQIIAWGLVATFQAFISNYPSYLATRLLLGLLEAGFIPGGLYYLSTWYKKNETSLRITLFFLGQMFAAATSSLISAGLLRLTGKAGLAGWRWIFLVEGLITIFAGIAFVLFLPPAVGNGKPLISLGGRWSYFTERESHIMRNRVLLDDPNKAKGHIKISGSDILYTLRQPRVWLHVLITLSSICTVQGLSTYTPSMIKSFGFGAIRANALASVPTYCAIVFTLVLSYLCDKTGHRGPFVLLAATWSLISYACLRTVPARSSKWHKYGVIAVANVPFATIHILNIGWLSVYCKTPQERSVSMAIIVMAANAAGIPGSQIFRADDAPRYLRGLTVITAVAAFCWLMTVVQNVQYYIRRKRRERESLGLSKSPNNGTEECEA
ncbi:major facilitator superfamily domain-containing protein [Thermoascus aurantiacus ATCC 26904]